MKQFNFDKTNLEPELPFEEFTGIVKLKESLIIKEINQKQAAKYCGVSYKKYLAVLSEKQILGKNNVGKYMPFSRCIADGWFIVKTVRVSRPGFYGDVPKVTVTPLGLQKIKEILNGK